MNTMWSAILYITLVGLASAEHGWKNGNLYRYEVRGRTMAGLHQVADQYTGVLVKGKLTVQPKSDDTLNLQVHTFEQAEVHANLSGGWSTFIEDSGVSYKKLPVSDTPFELKLKNGVVDKMYVDKNLPTWEVNVLKAIASQLQVDSEAKNLKKSRVNHVPVEGQTIGVYKTVEDTVTGECETIYDISPLPQYVLQSRPELVPLPNLIANGQVIDIVKTNDYNHCKQRMAYHFGLPGLTNWEAASNHMGSFLSRSSVSRIIVTGTLKSYTIQSSVTTNKIILAPHINNNQKGIVASSMNLTLEAVTSSSGSLQPVPNPRTINNLVY
uniref:Putative vitellogenin 2 n=1 Tax=Panstrongylus lignarius TaxID=156445 RepID=A0A224XFX9_9HEMI